MCVMLNSHDCGVICFIAYSFSFLLLTINFVFICEGYDEQNRKTSYPFVGGRADFLQQSQML